MPHLPTALFIALGYVALGEVALHYFSPADGVGVFWPASGWALGALLIWGRRYLWAVFLGAFLVCLLTSGSAMAAVGTGSAAAAAGWVGLELYRRSENHARSGLLSYWRMIFFVAWLGGWASAAIGTLLQISTGHLPAPEVPRFFLHWWMGDFLGVMLLTPLTLLWRQPAPFKTVSKRQWESLVIFGLTFAFGLVIFDGWHPAVIRDWIPKGYLLIPFVAWASVRLGALGVSLLLMLISSQAIYGMQLSDGIFAMTREELRILDTWLFLCILNLTGYSLAVAAEDRAQAASDLRIAAAAFDCQEGVLVTDSEARIIKANQSFSTIFGYSPQEVQGRTTDFLLAARYRPSFMQEAVAAVRRTNTWRGEVWTKRKNGDEFPEWVTMTAVKDDAQRLTHFVITHTDLSDTKRAEEKRLAAEVAHRQTLVREIHHRIKNNLQGVIGVLRHFSATHPATEQPIAQAVSALKSIASLHGLKGVSADDATHLSALIRAIAANSEGIWETPFSVEISRPIESMQLRESESVPIALILNELMVNAIKHGGKVHGHVWVKAKLGSTPTRAIITISNQGQWNTHEQRCPAPRHGLNLVQSLMPRHGAQLHHEQHGSKVLARLELEEPALVFSPVTGAQHAPDDREPEGANASALATPPGPRQP